MKSMRAAAVAASILMVVLLTLVWAAMAEVPQKLYYQAILEDAERNPVTTPTQVVFTIWDAEALGAALWAETLMVAPSERGEVTLKLGDVHPINEEILTGEPRYLGTKVGDDDEMSQRVELVSGPYAMRVATVDGSRAGEVSGQVTITPGDEPPALLVTGSSGESVKLAPSAGDILRGVNLDGDDAIVIGYGLDGGGAVSIYEPGDVKSGSSVSRLAFTLSTDDDGLLIYDFAGNLVVEVGLGIDGGGAVSFWEPGGGKSGSAGTKRVELRRDGLVMFGESEADTTIYALPNGNIRGQGQIAMGENSSGATWSTVFGYNNTASGDSATVSGGYDNTASGMVATIGGGFQNNADGNNSTVGGGFNNAASAQGSTIGGGHSNTASTLGAAVGGGSDNSASNNYSTVAGGAVNNASGVYSAVGGGTANAARGEFSVVCGGGGYESVYDSNAAIGGWSSIGGGKRNIASGNYSRISGGSNNTAGGYYSTILGGSRNHAGAAYSCAAGRRASVSAAHHGTFLWADSTDCDFQSNTTNEFAALATGGVRFVTAVDGSCNPTAGAILAAGSGSWASVSDKNLKEEFANIDTWQVLEKVAALPVTTWKYRAQDESIRHIGPSAQDFYDAFGVGEDDKYITTVDADGVALAAIKELYSRNRNLEERITELEKLLEKPRGNGE